MVFREPLAFVSNFIAQLNKSISSESHHLRLSARQTLWLSFCVTAILLSNSLCWARFERLSVGKMTVAALSWMFRASKIPWEILLTHSIRTVLRQFGISEGQLVIDDSDNKRSKRTSRVAYVHKMRDKSSGGYIMGQQIVFLLLVTPKINLPVGFAFYQPDPAWKRWQKEDKRLKKAGIAKINRPAKPPRDTLYPTMQMIALNLLTHFAHYHPMIHVRCVLADALYGTQAFMQAASQIFGGVQVISQIRRNQRITTRNRSQSVQAYFTTNHGGQFKLCVRGGDTKMVTLSGARLHVDAHKTKLFVIAVRYEGEKENRYIVATDLTWRMTDIAQAYTLRWLVEVFFQDWKSHEGWCQLAKQPGVDGAYRGLLLSLLTDHSLFFHEEQKALLEHKLPACTVGSLRARVHFEALTAFIREIISCDNPEAKLEGFLAEIREFILLKPSSKHMNPFILGRMEQTPGLKHRGRNNASL
jgi:hypothetical protein